VSRLFPVATDELTTDDWYTPPYIIEAIGLTYDLDPCAPKGGVPWIPAAAHYSLDDDGLSQPWHGRVWLNPPYSKPYPWVERLAEHGDGIALVPADTSTRGWHRWVVSAEVVLFLRDRVQFVQPGNDNVTSARFPSALVAFGEVCAVAVEASNLGWCVEGRVG
jgi:phage N-6-adenine-methyltransferase